MAGNWGYKVLLLLDPDTKLKLVNLSFTSAIPSQLVDNTSMVRPKWKSKPHHSAVTEDHSQRRTEWPAPVISKKRDTVTTTACCHPLQILCGS